MARRRTSRKKPGSPKAVSGAAPKKAPPKPPAYTVPQATMELLKGLVEQRKQDIITASWDLGKLAKAVLKQAEVSGDPSLTTHKLAEDIGLIRKPDGTRKRTDDSTLRQMIKFAKRVRRNTAARLQRAGVSWRGVVYWLGVGAKPNYKDLLRKMLAGLKNSTEIRQYIADNFNRKAHPRFSENLKKACNKVQTRAQRLIEALEGFECARKEHWTSLTPSERKKARTTLRDLDRMLKSAGELITSTHAKVRSLR